jgi:hypothetical protein
VELSLRVSAREQGVVHLLHFSLRLNDSRVQGSLQRETDSGQKQGRKRKKGKWKETERQHTSLLSSASELVLVALSDARSDAFVSPDGAVIIRTPFGDERTYSTRAEGYEGVGVDTAVARSPA